MAAAPVHDQRWPGPGRKLTRDVVARAALVYIDRFGSPRLTMRGLGQALGVEAMSLYRYVSSRQDLMDAVVTLLCRQLSLQMQDLRGAPWQPYLHTLAASLRQVAIEHPRAFPLLTAPTPGKPWLRPPLPSLDVAEEMLTILSDSGFTDDEAVDAYRTFSSFLLGQLVTEAAVRETNPPDATGVEASVTLVTGPSDLADQPTLTRMRALLTVPGTTEEFERSLTSLLDSLSPSTPSGHT